MLSGFRKSLSTIKEPSGISPGLDFLPDGYAERRRRRRTNTLCLGLFIIVVSAVGTTFYFSENSLAAVEAEYKAIEEKYEGAARQIEQVKQMLQKRKTVADRVELAVSLREKLPKSNVMAELTNALPPGVSLTDMSLKADRRVGPAGPGQTTFEQKTGQPAPAEAPRPLVYDTTLLVTGVSYTEGQVSDYIDGLNRSGYFESVDLRWVRKGSTIDKNDEAMRTFVISVTLDPEAEARPVLAEGTRMKPAPTAGAADGEALPGGR